MKNQRKRLGDLLVDAGMITEEQLQDTLVQKKNGQKIGDALLERGYINEQQLIEVLEFQLGIPQISLYRYQVDTSLLNLVSKEFAFRNILMPIKKEGNQLVVAMNDPMDYIALDDLRLSTGMQISPVIAKKEELMTALYKYYTIAETFEDLGAEDTDDGLEGENAPAIRLVNQILTIGVQLKASDIHIDPQETRILIRYRVDGVLHTDRILSRNIYNLLISRIKIMANLNITESRLPQDGRIKMDIHHIAVDLRISFFRQFLEKKS